MSQPNVLIFITDQQHADCLSLAGHPQVKTPNIDRLGKKGAWFRQAYTCSAICAPSRTSFMTGMYLRGHEHMTNGGDLKRDLPSMPSEARRAGYRTGICGKSHLPHSIFQHYDYAQTMIHYQEMLDQEGLSQPPPDAPYHQHFMSKTFDLPDDKHCVPWTGDRAIEFIDSTSEDPFFLWCSFDPPHPPLTPTADAEQLYDPDKVEIDWDTYEAFERSTPRIRAMIEDFWKVGSVRHNPEIFQKAVCRYFALITMIDEQVGRVLDYLEKKGLSDNTLIVFTSDHGDFAGQFGHLGKNLPGYDAILRIPLIYFDPQRQDHGRCVESMHQSLDLFPSLWERMGLEVPPTVQGRSFLPALEGYPDSGRDAIFAETHNQKTVQTHQWKLNFDAAHPERSQLFKMGANPDELTNLWDNPNFGYIRQSMMETLTKWMVECEQAGSVDFKAEPFIQSRWYNWLNQQPNNCASQENWKNFC